VGRESENRKCESCREKYSRSFNGYLIPAGKKIAVGVAKVH